MVQKCFKNRSRRSLGRAVKRRHQAGMASDRSLIKRRGMTDTLFTFLTFVADF
jgi:hypothetical protein